jgi:hypothetical protein
LGKYLNRNNVVRYLVGLVAGFISFLLLRLLLHAVSG